MANPDPSTGAAAPSPRLAAPSPGLAGASSSASGRRGSRPPLLPGEALLPGELERPVWALVRARRLAEIVAAARRVLEDGGREALTMRRVAEELGIQAPSLYKHFASKAELELALVADALVEIGHAAHEAVHDDEHALMSLLETYRRYSLAHPHLYRLATAGPLAREGLPPGLEEWAGNPWYVVTGDPYLSQALWSFAHGMVILELDDRYPPGSDLDATWTAGARAFERAATRGRAGVLEPSAEDLHQQHPSIGHASDDTEQHSGALPPKAARITA